MFPVTEFDDCFQQITHKLFRLKNVRRKRQLQQRDTSLRLSLVIPGPITILLHIVLAQVTYIFSKLKHCDLSFHEKLPSFLLVSKRRAFRMEA